MALESINFQELLPDDGTDLGVRISLTHGLSLGRGEWMWVAVVEKRRETKSGREGKPERQWTLMAQEGGTPADLLRDLANLYDAGEKPINPQDWAQASAEMRANLTSILDRLRPTESVPGT